MVVYHGSNRAFKQLKIANKLCDKDSTRSNEGLGIYFTTDIEIARSYGRYIYYLEINDKVLKDFRKRAMCTKYMQYIIKEVYKETRVDISRYFDVQSVINYMHCGGIQLSNLSREIQMNLESSDKWYSDIAPTKMEKIYRIIRRIERENMLVYMFSYHIPNIGVIKKIDNNIVRIIKRTESY